MIFIVRDKTNQVPPYEIKMVRQTPAIVPDGAGLRDFFCLGDANAAEAAGWTVVPVHDGWYAGDGPGGMAIWGHGIFWEVRDTPFTVLQACGPEAWPEKTLSNPDDALNVRQAIFRG